MSVSPTPPTLMVIHAHPDDEASQTGGTLARFSSTMRTVLVTCTDGRQGDWPESGPHDRDRLSALRSAELAQSAAALGIDVLVELGYHDSGATAVTTGGVSGRFIDHPIDDIADRLLAVMTRYRPQVVITYPDHGLSRHPDHIHTHYAATAAFARYQRVTTTRAKPALFYLAMTRTQHTALATRLSGFAELADIAVDDRDITVRIDIRAHRAQKRAALASYASQRDARILLSVFDVPGLNDAEHYQSANIDISDMPISSTVTDTFPSLHS
jgi:LmbE family N-acetylglucosaminyl deacetylase